MKKKRSKPQKRNKPNRANAPQVEDASRRAFMSRTMKFGLGLAVVTGGSVFAVSAVRATVHEQDLTRVGQGVPTVVQIHDPNCSLCTALQKETRKALKGFAPEELDYIVANICTEEGSRFAAEHGQPHVTLILLDPDGKPAQILNGPQYSGTLKDIFTAHAAAYRPGQ